MPSIAPQASISPAHAPARDARGRLERAAEALRLVPLRFDRAPVADALRRALAAAYVALDTGIDAPAHDESLDDAASALAAAIALLEPLRPQDVGGALSSVLVELEEARVSMSGAADAIAALRLGRRGLARGARPSDAPPPPAAPFRVSVGLPRAHTLARAPIVAELAIDPVVPLAERRRKKRGAPLPPEALRALADAAKRGEAADAMLGEEPPPRPPTPSAAEALDAEETRRIAEDCLSDLGSLGLLRAPGPNERWTDAAAFEQRLLDVLDALASLGASIVPWVQLHLAASPGPDPARAFAAIFTLGCVSGADAAAAAVDLALRQPPEARGAALDALSLAASPRVESALLDRLRDGLADGPRAIAIAALLARGAALPPGVLGDPLRASRHDRPRLARAIASSAVPLLEAVAALEELRDVDDEPGDPAADATFFAACEALLGLGHARAREPLRRAIDGGHPRADRAAALLCLAGNAEDVGRLARRLVEAPTPALARAIGRFGHVDALAPLVDLLSRDDEALGIAAADALARISGAPLTVTIEIPWGDGAPPPAPGEPPRPTRTVRVPSRDRAAWAAWLARDGRSLDRAVRLRRGRPMHPQQIVDELLDPATALDDRDEAARELALSGFSPRGFSTSAWVAAQAGALREASSAIAAARLSGGSWRLASPDASSRARR